MSGIVYNNSDKYTGEYNGSSFLLNTLISYGLTTAIMKMMQGRSEIKIENWIKEDIKNNIDIDSFLVNDTWNNSVKKIKEQIDNLKNFSTPSGYISLEDIKNGDAGASFSKVEVARPWKNISGESYKEVRGKDSAFERDDPDYDFFYVHDGSNLDFTNKQDIESQLRLIMPEYERVIRIDDLDRNFWVISQVLSGISNFLFNNDGLKNIFKNLILEIAHLWSNIALLWLASEGEDDTDIDTYVEFATLNNQNFYHMNYDFYLSENELDERVRKLFDSVIDSHPKSNICLLIEIRDQHYLQNCYAKVSYKLCLFDRLYGNEWIRNIKFDKGAAQEDVTDLDLIITSDEESLINEQGRVIAPFLNSAEFLQVATGYKKNGTKYEFQYPFSNLKNVKEDWDYKLGLRIDPYIGVDFSGLSEDIDPMLTINFQIEDIGYEMYSGEKTFLYTGGLHQQVTDSDLIIPLNKFVSPVERDQIQKELGYSQYGGFSGENLTGILLNTLAPFSFELIELSMPGFTNTAVQKVDSNGMRLIPTEIDFPRYIQEKPEIFSNAVNILKSVQTFLSETLLESEEEIFQNLTDMPDDLVNQLLIEDEPGEKRLKTEQEALDIIILTCTYPYRLWYDKDGRINDDNYYHCYDYNNGKIQKIKIENGYKKGQQKDSNTYITDVDMNSNPLNWKMSDLGYCLLVCKKQKKDNNQYNYDCALIEDYYYVSTLPEEMVNLAGGGIKHGLFKSCQPILFQDPATKNWLMKWVRFSGASVGYQLKDENWVWYGANNEYPGYSTAGVNDSIRRAAVYSPQNRDLKILAPPNDNEIEQVTLFQLERDKVTQSYPGLITEETFPEVSGQNGPMPGIVGRVQTNYILYSYDESSEEYVTDWCARIQSRNTDLYERFYNNVTDSVHGFNDFSSYASETDAVNSLWAPGQSKYEYYDQCLNWYPGVYKVYDGDYKEGRWRLLGTWYIQKGAVEPGEDNFSASQKFADMESLINNQYVLMSSLPVYDYGINPSTGDMEG